MDYAEWAPYYRRIQSEFGFPFDREESSARLLERLLPVGAKADPLPQLRPLFHGKSVIVAGLAPSLGAPPLWKLPSSVDLPVLVAADGATSRCLDGGLVPDVIVTDLDGPIPAELSANARGARVVVHAHGDNEGAIREWLPQFTGILSGSWAGPPRAGLLNVGGFTDGDRAAFLAEHLGARRIFLWAFDFEDPEESEPKARQRKLAKLRWARELLGLLASRRRSEVYSWDSTGAVSRYEPSVTGPSIQ